MAFGRFRSIRPCKATPRTGTHEGIIAGNRRQEQQSYSQADLSLFQAAMRLTFASIFCITQVFEKLGARFLCEILDFCRVKLF
jgi:hypothetical protein